MCVFLQGPIIVCLDTSGSMQGPPETVAKALVLETMRGAHRQNRAGALRPDTSARFKSAVSMQSGMTKHAGPKHFVSELDTAKS